MIKEKLSFKLFKKPYILAGILYSLILVTINSPTFGDYSIFSKEPFNIMYAFDRWNNWSSRLFLESANNLFSKNLPLWLITTIIFSIILFWSLGRILKIKSTSNFILLFCLFLLINPIMLASAGVFATTISYLWPVATFSLVVSLTINPIKDPRRRRFSNFIILPALIFSICQEQMAVLAVIFFGVLNLKEYIEKRKINKNTLIMLFISLLGVFNILISPGNETRKISEILNHWPDFANLSLLNKIQIGSTATFSRLFMAPEPLLILFIILTLLLAYKKRHLLSLGLSAISNILTLSFFFPQNSNSSYIAQTNPFFKIRQLAINLSHDNLLDKKYMMLIILICAIILSLALTSIILTLKKSKKSLFITISILAGLAISLAVSLSPTIFKSSTRTLFPLMIILISVNYLLLEELFLDKFKKGANK